MRYAGDLSEDLSSVSVKARSRFCANVGIGSTLVKGKPSTWEGWITSALPVSWHVGFGVSFSSISQKDKLVCRSASIEPFRPVPWVKRFGPSLTSNKGVVPRRKVAGGYYGLC
jgi:hypothetical protein